MLSTMGGAGAAAGAVLGLNGERGMMVCDCTLLVLRRGRHGRVRRRLAELGNGVRATWRLIRVSGGVLQGVQGRLELARA